MQKKVKCPRCSNQETCYEEVTDNGEKYAGCQKCGYSYSKHIVYDEDGNVELEADGRPKWCEHLNDEPYIAVKIEYKDGMVEGGHLADKETFEMFKVDYHNSLDLAKVNNITWSRYENGTFYDGTVYANPDQSMDNSAMNNMPMGKGGMA